VCVVQPESADQVSQVINVLNQQECAFTIKSGGHGFQAGTSNIHNGLVIDLIKLNGIELSDNGSTAAIGTASRWGDVYLKLQEHGLLTVGGRVASVGVGGFTLGGKLGKHSNYSIANGSTGGISFLSRRHGWALDNVKSFEVNNHYIFPAFQG
jgi:FAD/FMN-containing dehydrogenase